MYTLIYPWLTSYALAHARPLVALCGLTALFVIWASVLAQTRWEKSLLVIMALLVWVMHSALVPILLFLPPVLINLLLAWLFGKTLRAEEIPLITRFARLEQGEISPELASYTRKLTAAWTGFFLLMALISVALAWSGNLMYWSIFTSFINYLCAGLFMLGEYLYRRARFAQYDHLPPWQLAGLINRALRDAR
jgi:uncharacterized membrane protein